MSRKCWNGTLAGQYLCIRPLSVYLLDAGATLQKLEVGELYENVNLDLRARSFMLKRASHLLESKWFAALQSVATDNEGFVDGGLIVGCENHFEQCLFGPLSQEEVDEYATVEPRNARLDKFLNQCVSKVRKLSIGNLVQVWHSEKKVTGVFRCRSPLFDDLYNRKIVNGSIDAFWIGIELSGKYAGKGNSDGSFKGDRYIACGENGALFVSFVKMVWNRQNSCDVSDLLDVNFANLMMARVIETNDVIVETLRRDKYLLKPSRGLNVHKLETHMRRELHHDPTSLVICCRIPQSLIDEYGEVQHLYNLDIARDLPDVELLRTLTELTEYVIIVQPEKAQQVRESIELQQVHIKVPTHHADHFRKANSPIVKAMRDISDCNVKLQEKKGTLEISLTGLVSELHAARLVLDEELGALDGQHKEGKSKNKKKKNKQVSVTETEVAAINPEVPDAKVKIKEVMNLVDDGEKEGRKTSPTEIESEAASEQISHGTLDSEEQRGADCVVCLSERASAAFFPCGHRHTCPACAEKLSKSKSPHCPTCREVIRHYCRIYL